MTRPTRYTENNSSRDWIDEFTATSTAEEVRGAYRFTIGKYLRRYGKKDDPLQEALKIQDYASRLVEFERQQRALQDGWTPEAVKAAAMPADFGQQNVIEPAAESAERQLQMMDEDAMPGSMGIPMDMPDDFGQQHTIEPAAEIDDDSQRMQAIGQNGNGGEHYPMLCAECTKEYCACIGK